MGWKLLPLVAADALLDERFDVDRFGEAGQDLGPDALFERHGARSLSRGQDELIGRWRTETWKDRRDGSTSLLDLQIRADKIIRQRAHGDCGCYADQAPRRVASGCLSFVVCDSCGGRVRHDRRRLVPSSALP
jgi:hypothetical protein